VPLYVCPRVASPASASCSRRPVELAARPRRCAPLRAVSTLSPRARRPPRPGRPPPDAGRPLPSHRHARPRARARAGAAGSAAIAARAARRAGGLGEMDER